MLTRSSEVHLLKVYFQVLLFRVHVSTRNSSCRIQQQRKRIRMHILCICNRRGMQNQHPHHPGYRVLSIHRCRLVYRNFLALPGKARIRVFHNLKQARLKYICVHLLQTLLSYATPNNPQAEILKTQIEELKEKIVELEEGKGLSTNPASKDIFIPTSKFPNLSLQYARLLRDTKVQQTLYELLIQQYEMARIQEAKDTPTVQVLDVAKVPEKSSKPNRKQIILVSTITAIFFSIFMIFFIEYLEKARKRSQL